LGWRKARQKARDSFGTRAESSEGAQAGLASRKDQTYAKKHIKLALILVFALFSTVQMSRAAGVTIITHGANGFVEFQGESGIGVSHRPRWNAVW